MYEYLFKPDVIARHCIEVGLYKRILRKCELIFDIGAYDGHKTAAFLEICDHVVACEPDPVNFGLLKIRFRKKRHSITLKNLAISDKIGESDFFIHHGGSAFNTLNMEWKNLLEADRQNRWKEEICFLPGSLIVQTSTLDELIRVYGMPDFIKIDVEGYERHVFMGLSQKVPCVSFECLVPEFKDDLIFILERLNYFDDKTRFNIIHEEKLLFAKYQSQAEILEWVESTEIFSFDIVAISGDHHPICI